MTSNTSSSIELTSTPVQPATFLGDDDAETVRNEENRLEFSLPRVDGGKEAWLFLAGSFFIEALVWGA